DDVLVKQQLHLAATTEAPFVQRGDEIPDQQFSLQARDAAGTFMGGFHDRPPVMGIRAGRRAKASCEEGPHADGICDAAVPPADSRHNRRAWPVAAGDAEKGSGLMIQSTLGDGLTVSSIGLGAMGMSAYYGPTDEKEAIATLRHAVDIGVTFIDTAEAYGPFENEKLIGRSLGSRRSEITIATKASAEMD